MLIEVGLDLCLLPAPPKALLLIASIRRPRRDHKRRVRCVFRMALALEMKDLSGLVRRRT